MVAMEVQDPADKHPMVEEFALLFELVGAGLESMTIR